MRNDSITAVRGIKVGHAQDPKAGTGCTVLLLEPAAPVAYEARGGWPGTYDTDSAALTKTFVKKHAIFLTGGDVFGFAVAKGIRDFLPETARAEKKGRRQAAGRCGRQHLRSGGGQYRGRRL